MLPAARCAAASDLRACGACPSSPLARLLQAPTPACTESSGTRQCVGPHHTRHIIRREPLLSRVLISCSSRAAIESQPTPVRPIGRVGCRAGFRHSPDSHGRLARAVAPAPAPAPCCARTRTRPPSNLPLPASHTQPQPWPRSTPTTRSAAKPPPAPHPPPRPPTSRPSTNSTRRRTRPPRARPPCRPPTASATSSRRCPPRTSRRPRPASRNQKS